MKNTRKAYHRKHNHSRIKLDVSYEYHELAKLLNVSKGTVREWVKRGLPVMNTKRPHLIKGEEAKAFLKARNTRAKHTCELNELYCLSCRLPHRTWENAIALKAVNEKKLIIMGICEVCGSKTSKIQPMRYAPEIVETFNVHQWQGGHILARMHPSLNCHFQEESKT